MTLLPVGTVTFLFTDIVDSTRLWDAEPEAMKQAHARHVELIVAGVLEHNGHLVRARGEADNTFSVFVSPSDALAAACAFQRALAAESWPTSVPVRVRAALHCGHAELRDGDYNSTAVNRCARLRALASSGQTLVSQVVADMASDSLPSDVTLLALGSHRLKDLQRPEQVYQLCHPDLPAELSPLRSLGSLPTNLPQQLNSFIGREKEIALLVSWLRPHGEGASGLNRLLETIRQYSRERLEESAEAQSVRCRHRNAMLQFVEETAAQLGGPTQVELLNLGNICGTLGDHAGARRMQEESLRIRRQLGDKQGMATVLSNLGFCALLQNDYAAARSTLTEGLRLCRELNNLRGTPYALEYMAMLAAAENRPEPAAQLYGAACGLRERFDMSLSPTDGQSMQETHAAAVEQTGQETFDTLFARGRALTLEQAVDFALTIYP